MPTTTELTHTTLPLTGGGTVTILDTGAAIGPEAVAMLQALHSRSTGGIKKHLEVLAERGPERFMATYYVGYGHRSIGDCGTVTVFVEGVSMLTAKAIQDWRLYAGQESSTRYVDFTNQPMQNPIGTGEGAAILEAWRTFYLRGVRELPTFLSERYQRTTNEDPKVYAKAIAARTFDIMRAFLPAGTTTNLAWHMNLRQFSDELALLVHHPLAEVREVAHTVTDGLQRMFPSSFSHTPREALDTYHEMLMRSLYEDEHDPVPFALTHDGIDHNALATYRQALTNRPLHAELPRRIAECGVVGFQFTLDFGSYRDLQRHRAIVQRMPLLTTKHGFGQWYLDELPPTLRTDADALVNTQIARIGTLAAPREIAQYYCAMGFTVAHRITGDLHALTYLVELRTTRFVHPTLRARMRQVADVLYERYAPYGLVLHLDPEPDRFDVRRGMHDIVRTDA